MAWFLRHPKVVPQHLLITRTDRIGDLMLTLPSFEAAARELGIKISVAVAEANAPLLKYNPYITDVIGLSDQAEPRQTAGMLLRMGFDGILVMVNDPLIRSLMPLLKEIPMRMGPLSKPAMLKHYNYPVIQKRSKSQLNEAQYNLELLRGLGWAGSDQIHPRIYFGEQEPAQLDKKLAEVAPKLDLSQGFAIVHAGMGGSALNWPMDNFKAVLAQFCSQGRQVVLTGGSPAEVELNEGLMQGLEGNMFNLAGKLSLRQLAGLCSRAKLFLGPSTGPTHVANAAGCPVVSFYPPIQVQSKTRWQPYLAKGTVLEPEVNCPAKYKCKGPSCVDYPCMDKIGIEQALAACQELWP